MPADCHASMLLAGIWSWHLELPTDISKLFWMPAKSMLA